MKKKKKKKSKGRKSTEEEFERRCADIVEMTDTFCADHLNEDYRNLCWEMMDELHMSGLPLDKGKPASWAGGMIHALGWVNFLHDPSTSPCMTSAEVAEGFGLSQGTIAAKSRLIRDALDMVPLDPDWCTEAMLEDNPLVWTLEIDGLAVDVRMMPREAQEEAYSLGLIPYIPADRQKPPTKSDPGTGATILKFPSDRNKTPRPESPDEPNDNIPGLFDGLQ